jgi:IS4 transposase
MDFDMELISPFIEKRLKNNGALFFKRIMERKVVSLRKLGDTRAETVRFERWIGNEKVKIADLIQTEQARLGPIVKGRHVLAIQDTSELNYQKYAGRVKGLGTVGNGKDVGFFIHPMLVLDAKSTACLGSAAIHIENRLEGASENYKKLPIEEKESYRWISTAESSKKTLLEANCVTFIGDRENDIYEFIDRIPDEKTHVLTRVWHDRCLENGDKIFSHLEKQIEVGQLVAQVSQDKRNNREKREAVLSVKFDEVVIKKSKSCTDKEASKTIKLSIVEAKEINCPANQKEIHWVLLTTHKVSNFEEAQQIILWYRSRWNVEQVFRTMKKQGLDVESSQIESAESLMKLAVIALCAAIQILQLVLARDGTTDQKTSDVFSEEEQTVLGMLLIKLEGKTEKQKNPYPKENLSWGSWIIARLGGWNGYKNERPGPGTMGWGLQRFQGIFDGWKLLKDVCAG